MRLIKDISSWCYKTVSPKLLIVSILLFVVFMMFILPEMAERSKTITGMEQSPDTSFIYSTQDLYSMAEGYGAEGRSYYIKSRYTFDLAWPVVYLFFLVSSITAVFRYFLPDSSWRLVNVLPFVGVIFDFLENTTASIVMYRYPLPSPVIAELAPIFTFLKWSFIGASIIALFVGLSIQSLRVALINDIKIKQK